MTDIKAELLGALIDLHDDCVEYCRINHLHSDKGGPATTHAMRRAAAAIEKATGGDAGVREAALKGE